MTVGRVYLVIANNGKRVRRWEGCKENVLSVDACSVHGNISVFPCLCVLEKKQRLLCFPRFVVKTQYNANNNNKFFNFFVCFVVLGSSQQMTSQQQRNSVSLRGSVATVTEFFGFSVNSILYQRGIYPAESFAQVPKYGLPMMVTKDDALKQYLAAVLSQMANWLSHGLIHKLVLVINSIEKGSVLERWEFDVDTTASEDPSHPPKGKSDDHVRAEIQAVMRQITASVSFLPMITEDCAFDLLVYTNTDCDIPAAWELSDPRLVLNPSGSVKLRSFATSFHRVDAAVSFA